MNLQTELDRSRPFSTCFSGGGEVAEIDKPVGFMQHGLYFGHDGKLLVDHAYNAEKLALLKKLGLNPEEPVESVLESQAENRVPLNPEIVAELETKSDAELAAMGTKLVELLAAKEITVEAPTDRNGLIRFIAEQAS